MTRNLKTAGIHYFTDHAAAGAALVEILECTDTECSEEE